MATWYQEWTTSYSALSSTEQDSNAQIAYDYLRENGYTVNAALGVCANLLAEGLMNPGQWQGDGHYSTSSGFGLGQWTPSTKFSEWLGVSAGNKDMMNGDKQMEYLVENVSQWDTKYVNTSGYSSYYNTNTIYFATQGAYAVDDTHSAEDLAIAWCAQWERPNSKNFKSSYETRRNNAGHYRDVLNLGSGVITDIHNVIINITGNGTAYATPSSGKEGTTITLHESPNGTDTFYGFTVISGDITISSDFTFTMANTNVIIKAEFSGKTPSEYITSKNKWIYYMRPLWTYYI